MRNEEKLTGQVSVRLAEELEKALNEGCVLMNRERADLMRDALSDYLAKRGIRVGSDAAAVRASRLAKLAALEELKIDVDALLTQALNTASEPELPLSAGA